MYEDIKTLAPPGRTTAQSRTQRAACLSSSTSDNLELRDTIGEEEVVFVVVDPQELPRTWASVDLLGERIGECTDRTIPEDVASDQSVTMEEQGGHRRRQLLLVCNTHSLS